MELLLLQQAATENLLPPVMELLLLQQAVTENLLPPVMAALQLAPKPKTSHPQDTAPPPSGTGAPSPGSGK